MNRPLPGHESAVATLEALGYTYHGCGIWKAPDGRDDPVDLAETCLKNECFDDEAKALRALFELRAAQPGQTFAVLATNGRVHVERLEVGRFYTYSVRIKRNADGSLHIAQEALQFDDAVPAPCAGAGEVVGGRVGFGAHALAAELAEAALKDDADPEGHDISAGLFGPNVSEWLRKVAREYLTQPAAGADVVPAWKLERMRHIANEWADMATSALQWLRNITEGISTPAEALENTEQALQHCRKVNDAPGLYGRDTAPDAAIAASGRDELGMMNPCRPST